MIDRKNKYIKKKIYIIISIIYLFIYLIINMLLHTLVITVKSYKTTRNVFEV